MNRTTFQVGTFEVNCSIISESDKAIVVDPGADATRIRAELKKQKLDLAAFLLTHAHFDHISAIPELQRAYPDLPVFISNADAKIISHPFNQFPPDYPLVAGLKNIKTAKDLGSFLTSIGWTAAVEVIDTPGHTPGGVCYLFKTSDSKPATLFSGDTLFCGSRHALLRFGRTHRLPRRRHGDAAGISRKAERPSQRHGGGSRPRNRDDHLPRGRVKSILAIISNAETQRRGELEP